MSDDDQVTAEQRDSVMPLFLVLLGLVLLVVFMLAAIQNADTIDKLHRSSSSSGPSFSQYLAATASSAGYLVAAVMCWVGAAIVAAVNRLGDG